MDDVVEALVEKLGADCVLVGDDVRGRQAGIWRADTIQAKALVRPRDTAQVAQALAIYKGLAGADQPKHVRLAATRGMLACAGKKPVSGG